MYGRLNNFEDLKQEVYLKLIENGGKIETNLSYDQNLVINVLMKGIKYAMFNYLSKNKFEISLIQQTADGYFDLLDIIEDNTYNPQEVFENSNIGLSGNKQMALYANIRNPFIANSRKELVDFYIKNIDGYSDAKNEDNIITGSLLKNNNEVANSVPLSSEVSIP